MAEDTRKNILEVDVVQSIDKTDTVLVNDSGSLKQVSVETLVLSGIPDQYVTESELTGKGYATTAAMNSAVGAKLDKNQGSSNSGKYLSVGSDGNVTLVNAPSSGGGSGTPGKDGREIEIQNNGIAIQWRYVGDSEWTDLVQLSDLKGEGIPEGGTTGQVLTKNSDSDGDASWKNPSAVSDEQVKTAVRDYFEENPVSGMTQKQINALDSLFRVIAYSDNDVLNSEYKNFKEAFGLSSEDEPGDAGEGLLKNGSATFSNGATLTVSDGKHVSLYLPKKDVNQCYFNISDYEKNTTDVGSAANVDNQLPIYTLKKGDTVSISMYNIIVNGGNETYPGNNQDQVAINLRKANSNISCSTNNVSIHGGEAIEDKTSITEMELAEHVGALMLFVQNYYSDITITFDIDVKVNGETIKWY